jgi:hypothetical protein
MLLLKTKSVFPSQKSKFSVLANHKRRLLEVFMILACSSCLAFSEVEVKTHRLLWLEVQQAAKTRGEASNRLPKISLALPKNWLAKVQTTPELVQAVELDLIRQDLRPEVDVAAFRRILKNAYAAAPQLSTSFPAKRLDAFLHVQAGDVKSAQATLAILGTWCKNPNDGDAADGFNRDEHCSPMLLQWIVDGNLNLDPETLPKRSALQEQTFDCANDDHDVSDLLEFDLVHDLRSKDTVAQLGMRSIWDALLQGCSLKYSGNALKVLAHRSDALLASGQKALQALEHSEVPADFDFLQDRLPWPVTECDYARSPECTVPRQFSALHKRHILQRIIGLAKDFSRTPQQIQERQQRAGQLLASAHTQLRDHQIDAARASFEASLHANWNVDADYSRRLIDSLSEGAAPPSTVNPKLVSNNWTYSFSWFDEIAFEKHQGIYRALLPPKEFLKLQRRNAWERVLTEASDLVNEPVLAEPAVALMRLHGTWHDDHLLVEGLQLPWPAQFERYVASDSKSLSEQERLALFARMQVIVSESELEAAEGN